MLTLSLKVDLSLRRSLEYCRMYVTYCMAASLMIAKSSTRLGSSVPSATALCPHMRPEFGSTGLRSEAAHHNHLLIDLPGRLDKLETADFCCHIPVQA